MNTRSREGLLALACLLIAALVYWSADQIPVSLMAKISAGLVPKMIAVSLALVTCLHLIMTFKSVPEAEDEDSQGAMKMDVTESESEGFSVWRVLFSSMLLGLFILCLEQGWLGFWLSACLFTALGIVLLSEISVRSLVLATMISLLSVSLTVLLFTRVFTVILP